MESQSIIIIALLVGIFAAMAWWHKRENRQLADFLARKKLDITTTERLMRFAWSRTIQLLFTAAFGIIVIISYDWEFNETRNALIVLNDAMEQRQAADEARAKEVAVAPPAPAALPITTPIAPASLTAASLQAATTTAPIPPQGIPAPVVPAAEPVTLTTPQTLSNEEIPASEGESSEAVQMPLNEPTNILPISELPEEAPPSAIEQVYNPEREQSSQGDEQSSMDDIKKRYEDILVIYMFLKQCNRIENTDYNIITSALAQEMASVNAPGRMQFDIVNSAKGSYQEIYSQSPCDGAGINKLTRQYHQYIDVLKTNFPPQ